TDTPPLEGSTQSPRDVLRRLLARQPPAEPIGKSDRYEILRVLVKGASDGKAVSVTADCHAGPRAGWGIGPDIDTGAPPSIVAQMLLSGAIERRGVLAPEDAVPVEPFIAELVRRGMKV